MKQYKLVETNDELLNSLLEFNKETNYYRELLGNAPVYFVHSIIGGKHQFGLSKFCAFKNITAEDYIAGFRYYINGGPAQIRLKKITTKEWMKYSNSPKAIQYEFKKWIHSFFPNYNINNAAFITIEIDSAVKKQVPKLITQEELELVLEQKKVIGLIGEEIAYKYECERLARLGAKKPSKFVTHTSLINAAAGFDIFSDFEKSTRLIEVKSNISGHGDIFITQTELESFINNVGKSYFYIVSVTDVKERKGHVTKEIQDINELGDLEPVLFKVKHRT